MRMEKTNKNILIAGEPGIGKSTLIQVLVADLKSLGPVGFYTEEIRVDGSRKGFRAVGLDGRRQNLAHVDLRSRTMVGKYRVDVGGFDRFMAGINLTGAEPKIVIIDEIGQMECFCARFREDVKQVLDQDRIVIATVAQTGVGLIEEVKHRDDVDLLQLTRRNRSAMAGKIMRKIRAIRFA